MRFEVSDAKSTEAPMPINPRCIKRRDRDSRSDVMSGTVFIGLVVVAYGFRLMNPSLETRHGNLFVRCGLRPVERPSGVPCGLGCQRFFRYSLFQEIRLRGLEVAVLNDGGCDENEEALAITLLAVAAK